VCAGSASNRPSRGAASCGSTKLDLFWLAYVGLRSQSLADPTLSYGALSGRRAVSWSWTRLRKVAAAIEEQLSPTASQRKQPMRSGHRIPAALRLGTIVPRS
jgi:hypothetical protein